MYTVVDDTTGMVLWATTCWPLALCERDWVKARWAFAGRSVSISCRWLE